MQTKPFNAIIVPEKVIIFTVSKLYCCKKYKMELEALMLQYNCFECLLFTAVISVSS